MSFFNKTPSWRIGFAVFCLVYTVWVVYLSFDNFDKVHSEYRSVSMRLKPSRINDTALQELVDKCRKDSRRELKRIDRYRKSSSEYSTESDDPCLSWPKSILEERQQKITEKLVIQKGKFKRKIIVFYISFSFFFLILPMVFLYLLLSFLIWVFRGLKFVK
jgi:hypothetical protein